MRTVAFHTLENNVTVTLVQRNDKNVQCISPMIFADSMILQNRRAEYKRDKRSGEIICLSELESDISFDEEIKEGERLGKTMKTLA